MFGKTEYEIGRIFGVPIKVDFSLLLVAGMFAYQYAVAYPGHLLASLVAGTLAAAALAVALIVHEAGHAAAALAQGSRVHEITIMFFGGRAAMSRLPRAPLGRAAISLAGPAAGLLLFVAASLVAAVLSPIKMLSIFFADMAQMTLILSIFNMIPALPLDGGNVLLEVLTYFKGRPYAIYFMARLTKILAVALGVYGLFTLNFLLVLVAFFAWNAAKGELVRAAFDGDDADTLDDDVVVISPPPYGKENEYTRIRRPR